jgi:hypothetical protein
MTDDVEYPRRGYDTRDVEAMQTESHRGGGRRRWKLVLAAVLLAPIVLFALWAWITLSFTYSRGDRTGYVQKLSEKGWICKTWEGELAMATIPGTTQQFFQFTVRDDSVAAEINRHLGRWVKLTYEEHRGVPTTCFGDTQYFVVGVEPATDGAPPPAPSSRPTAGQPTPGNAPPSPPPADR